MPGQINIQPEPFEFDMQLRGYEGESFESGFGEYESGRPQPAAPPCPPYERGEVEKSRTQAGHLPSDVIQDDRGLLIADFGVDWRTPRASLRREAALKNWINTMIQIVRANPKTEIRISGYSDCVGTEKNNAFLRRGRAQRVAQLLQQLAGPQWRELRAKIKFIGAAPANDHVADNATSQGRAQNRGVLITHTRIIDMRPTVITGKKIFSPFARTFEGPSSPLEMLNKFFDAFTLIDTGLAIAEVAATEAFMLGAGIVIAPIAQFVALGAPHEEALNELRKREILEGLSLGIVLGAEGLSNKWIIDHGFVKKWPVQSNYPEYGKQLQGLYNTSLVAGLAHGRQFSTVATKNLFTFVTSQMTDWAKREYLGYPNTLTGDQWVAYSRTWSAKKWENYYRLVAAIVSRQIKLEPRSLGRQAADMVKRLTRR
jgi:outer membrane protein OmpA-like peptidoglycan-associated protein